MTQSIKFLGDYCYQGYEITVKAIEVQQGTIGQYTGRIDTNGIKVFEGDIVHCVDSLYPLEFTGVVDFADSSFRINSDGCTHYRWQDYEVTVIGNTADGLEMVKGGHK